MEWERITLGCTDAVVRRSPDGLTYAKTAGSPESLAELLDERDRLEWLAHTEIPAPRVLDWTGSTLVTSAVPGLPASALTPEQARRAVPSLVDALVALHALPTAECPFDRRLAVTLAQAEQATADGRVGESDFDAERAGRTAADLLAELRATADDSIARETADLVVCHGDACLPNVLVDPRTLRVTGWIDVGRLGVADRHLDLALLNRSAGDNHRNPSFAGCADALLDAYPGAADPQRLGFYRLLDEFF